MIVLAVALVLAAASRSPAADPARAPTPPPRAEQVLKLVGQLDDDRFAVRQQADRELRAMGRPVIPLLEKELPRAPSLEVRLRLGRMLDELGGDERRVRVLLKQLRDGKAERRAEAMDGLRKLGKEALTVLHKQMEAGPDAEQSRLLLKVIRELEMEEQEGPPGLRLGIVY
jgi:hypothetical protein